MNNIVKTKLQIVSVTIKSGYTFARRYNNHSKKLVNNISSYIIIAISYIERLNCLRKKQIIFNFALQPDKNE